MFKAHIYVELITLTLCYVLCRISLVYHVISRYVPMIVEREREGK